MALYDIELNNMDEIFNQKQIYELYDQIIVALIENSFYEIVENYNMFLQILPLTKLSCNSIINILPL